MCALLCSVAGGLPIAHGQAKAGQVYADPDGLMPEKPAAVANAANHALTSSERSVLCPKGRGFITFRLQVDGAGQIETITAVELHLAAREVPIPMLAKMKERIRQDVISHVPDVDKPPTRNRWRRQSYTIPLRVFCP